MIEDQIIKNVNLGDVIIDKDGNEHEITPEKYYQLQEYQHVNNGLSPIRAGKITGKFLFYIWQQEKKLKKELDEKEFIFKLRVLSDKLGVKISVRGWCYLLEGDGIIDKTQFDKMERRINNYRRDGRLPIDFTAEDETRQFYNVEPLQIDYINPKEYIYNKTKDVKKLYKNKKDISFWDYQKYYIQVMVEKGDLVNLFGSFCKYFHIPIANAKGWSDLNSRNLMALRFKEAEEKELKPVLLYYADHDPAGLKIAETIKKNIEDIEKATKWNPENLIVDRIGLTKEFIDEHGLLWIPNLKTSSKKDLSDPEHKDHNKPYVKNYIKKYGVRKCEANAVLKIRKIAQTHLVSNIIKYLGGNCFNEYNKDLNKNRHEVRHMMKAVNFRKRITSLLDDVLELE